MKELWKDIHRYEGRYKISNTGRVFSSNRYYGSRILKTRLSQFGYPYVVLCVNQNRKTIVVHRLVALAFLDKPKDKNNVNHIDGDKTNNKVENLEWCNASENQLHAVRTGLRKKLSGSDATNVKLSVEEVIYIRKNFKLKTKKYLSEKFNITVSNIYKIYNRETWKNI